MPAAVLCDTINKKGKGGEPVDIFRQDMLRERLEDVLEPEMVKQYRLRRGRQCVYMPRFGEDAYLCSCGAVNPLGESCSVCGLEPEPLTREVLEELSREAEARLAVEAQERAAREEKRRAHEEARRKAKQRKKLIKLTALVTGCVAALALGVGLFWLTTRQWIPAAHYNKALQCLERGDYQNAHRSFTLAGYYGDAKAYLERFSVLTRTAYAEGEKSATRQEYTYDARGNRLIMSQETFGRTEDGQLSRGDMQTWINHYNDRGLPLQLEDPYGKWVYIYNEHGDVTSEEEFRPDGVQENMRYYSYIYDEQGRKVEKHEICSELISVNYSYEQSENYTYDDLGREILRTARANYPAATEGNYSSTMESVYDDSGRLIHRVTHVFTPQDPSGECEVVEQWTYSATGKVTAYSRNTNYLQEAGRNSMQLTTNAFNDRGDLVEERVQTTFPGNADRDAVQVIVYTYDREGRLSTKVNSVRHTGEQQQLFGNYTSTETYSYDLLGRLVSVKTLYEHANEENSYAQTDTFTHRADGSRKTGKQTVRFPDGSTTVAESTYDANGMVQTCTTRDEYGTSRQEYTYAYFYNLDEASN